MAKKHKHSAKPCRGWFDIDAPSGPLRIRRDTTTSAAASLENHREFLVESEAQYTDSMDCESRKGWDNNRGFEGALEDLVMGDAEQAAAIADMAQRIGCAMGAIITGETKKMKHSTIGSVLDVGRALSGDPEFMLRRRRVRSNSGKLIRIGISGSAHCGVEATDLMAHGAMALALVSSLENRGYDVGLYRVDGAKGYGSGVPRSFFFTECKRPGAHVNPAKLAATLASPAYLRRITFGVWEQDEIFAERFGSGYGRPCDPDKKDLRAFGLDMLIGGVANWAPDGGWGQSPEKLAAWFVKDGWPAIKKDLGV